MFKFGTTRARQNTESARPREEVHLDPSTGRLMVVKKQLSNVSTDNVVNTQLFQMCGGIKEGELNCIEN